MKKKKKRSRGWLVDQFTQLSPDYFDQAVWLPPLSADDKNWLHAMARLDRYDDKKSLLQMLRSTGSVRDFYLADLIDRHIGRQAGRPPTPAYDLPPSQVVLYFAVEAVRNRPQDMSVNNALDYCAENFGVDREQLNKAYHGHRHSYSKAVKRSSQNPGGFGG